MKRTNRKLLTLLLCVIMAFGAVLPVFADELPEVEPTRQSAIESVTPVGDEPNVKLKLSAEGYKIEECTIPMRYDIVFKDGTSTSVQLSGEPSHFIPLYAYEYYFDVETPDGVISMYAGVKFYSDVKEAYFSVGELVFEQGSLGKDGVPVLGSSWYEVPIEEEKCDAQIDESNIIVRIMYFFYSVYLKVQKWFVLHFGK